MARRPRSGAGASLWSVAFAAPHAAVPRFEEALEAFGGAVSSFETAPPDDPSAPGPQWRIQLLAAARPDMRRLRRVLGGVCETLQLPYPEVVCERVREGDLVAGGLAGFQPVRAGRFTVLDPRAGAGFAPRSGALSIEPGLVYGTGQHETTRGCLLALDGLARRRRFARPLDLGCGTGVLALAMARTWRTRVVASDIDPAAVREALANARANALAPWIAGVAAAGFAAPQLRGRGRFDLIVANILAGPLVRLAPDVRRALAPRGALVLSGLLRRQEAGVLAAYRARGFRLRRRIALADWPTLVLDRAGGGFRRSSA